MEYYESQLNNAKKKLIKKFCIGNGIALLICLAATGFLVFWHLRDDLGVIGIVLISISSLASLGFLLFLPIELISIKRGTYKIITREIINSIKVFQKSASAGGTYLYKPVVKCEDTEKVKVLGKFENDFDSLVGSKCKFIQLKYSKITALIEVLR